MIIGTFVGLHVGGGFILGNTEASWSLGPMGAMYGLGLAFGMLLLGLVLIPISPFHSDASKPKGFDRSRIRLIFQYWSIHDRRIA